MPNDENPTPQGLLDRINNNSIIKFGGGGVAVVALLVSVALGIWSNFDPKILVGVGFMAFAMLMVFLVSHVWAGQRANQSTVSLASTFEKFETADPVAPLSNPLTPLPPATDSKDDGQRIASVIRQQFIIRRLEHFQTESAKWTGYHPVERNFTPEEERPYAQAKRFINETFGKDKLKRFEEEPVIALEELLQEAINGLPTAPSNKLVCNWNDAIPIKFAHEMIGKELIYNPTDPDLTRGVFVTLSSPISNLNDLDMRVFVKIINAANSNEYYEHDGVWANIPDLETRMSIGASAQLVVLLARYSQLYLCEMETVKAENPLAVMKMMHWQEVVIEISVVGRLEGNVVLKSFFPSPVIRADINYWTKQYNQPPI